MKVCAVIVFLAVFASAYSELQDCRIESAPTLILKYGEAFSIPESCLLLKCRGGNTFDVVSNCPTLFRGAPGDVAAQKSKEMGDLILSGKACQATSVV